MFLLRRPTLNPIIVKELRGRMRGMRPYAVLTFFLLVMVGVGYAINWLVTSQTRFGATVLSAQVGQALFSGLAMCELFLVVFLAPALTSGAISGEREQLTYDMLLATPLRPLRILWGKLFAALSYLFLLMFAAIPLFSVVLVFGGVAPRDMAKALLMLLIAALLFGAIGLFCSALVRRTAQATVLSYTITLLLIGLSTLAASSWGAFSNPPGQQVPPPLLYINPFSAMASITTIIPNNGGPFPMMGDMISYGGFSWQALLASGVISYGPNGAVVLPIFRASLLLYPALTLLLCWAGSHLVLARRRWRPRWSDLLFLLLLAGCVALAWQLRGWWLVLPPAAMG
jgi:ABC-type transport system involved in multi-copper enzyme maturation permease subunit